jgi:polyhydroxyalkanoate synthesis regulator phasin
VLIASTHELLGVARRRAERLDVTLERIGRMVQERGEQADVVAKELLEKSQMRAEAADRLIAQLLRKMEHATDEVERVLHKPFQEAHALSVGFRAAFESLFSRR